MANCNTGYTAEELYSDFIEKHKEELREKANEYNKAMVGDNVHSPRHYRLNIKGQEFEVIDVIKAIINNSNVDKNVVFEWGNALKYICRWANKNGIEDLEKCKVYLDYMINELERKND